MPSDWTVEAGRDAYLTENGFSVATYDVAYAEYPFLGWRIPIPNLPRRRWAVRLHDLHHVATGYGTDKAGEGEISAWELRRGLGPLGLYVGAIVLGAALLGLMTAPSRTCRAFRASRSSANNNLFHGQQPYEALLELSVAELRQQLGVPEAGLAQAPRALHALAPR